jgi:uncharacterized protein YjaZ
VRTTFIKPDNIKKYKSLDALMSTFFECAEDKVSEFEIGGSIEPGKPYNISYADFKENVEQQGIWGYIQNKTMHVWFKPDVAMEELITFIAHEAGHLNGRQYKNGDKEESKAELFEDVATYAYLNAVKILNEEKGHARKKVSRKK